MDRYFLKWNWLLKKTKYEYIRYFYWNNLIKYCITSQQTLHRPRNAKIHAQLIQTFLPQGAIKRSSIKLLKNRYIIRYAFDRKLMTHTHHISSLIDRLNLMTFYYNAIVWKVNCKLFASKCSFYNMKRS